METPQRNLIPSARRLDDCGRLRLFKSAHIPRRIGNCRDQNKLDRNSLYEHLYGLRYASLHLATIALLMCPSYAGSQGSDTQSSARDLVKDVVANEVTDRAEQSNWIYRVTKVVEQQTLNELEVETKDGPVYRLLAINDAPLDSGQRGHETARLNQLVREPSQQLAVKKQYDVDERRLENLVRLLPSAFVYQYDGWDGRFQRLDFRPDPAFVPPTMESKVLQSMAGTLLVDPQQKRLAQLNGRLIENVNFGFGVLGRMTKGGTFEIERTQVSSSQWKTHVINIHVNGRMLLFKTISKEQHETRSDFQPVAKDLDLRQAEELLQSRPEYQAIVHPTSSY